MNGARVALGVALAILLCRAAPALAQSCTITPSSLAFGAVSPVSGGAYTANGSLTVACSGYLPAMTVRACVNLGTGSGGTAYSPRTLSSGGRALNYNVYADPAFAAIIGSRRSGSYAPLQIDVPITTIGAFGIGSGSRTVTIYGRLAPNQGGAAAGVYASSFAGADAEFDYAPFFAIPTSTCAAIATPAAAFSFNVNASVINDCSISATNIQFGATGLLTQTLDASGSISVACTSGDLFSIALDAGRGAGATVADRRMTLSGSNTVVHYQLYSDAACALAWGDGSSGSSLVNGVGNGGAASFTVHARVSPQSTPPAGIYSDTITATIHY